MVCGFNQLLTEDELQLYIVNDTQLLLTIDSIEDNGTIALQTMSNKHLIVRRLTNTSEVIVSNNVFLCICSWNSQLIMITIIYCSIL